MSNCQTFTLPPVASEPHQVREVLRCILHTICFNRALGLVSPRDVDSELFDVTYVQCGDAEVESKIETKISEFCSCIEKAKPSELAQRQQLHLSFYEQRRKPAWFGTQDERLVWELWCINISLVQPADVASLQQQQQQQGAAAGRTLSSAGSGGLPGTYPYPAAPSTSPPTPYMAAASQQAAATQQGAGGRVVAAEGGGVGTVQGSGSSGSGGGGLASLDEVLALIVRHVGDRKDHIPPVVSSSTITFPFDITFTGDGRSSFGLSTVKKMLMHTTPPPMLG